MQLNDLRVKNKKSKRIGRGGKRGKTSGKGHKGQNARTGNSKRPALRDIIKKIPKLRGQGIHGNKGKSIINKFFAINLSKINEYFKDGEIVSANTLLEKGLVEKKRGRIPRIKILGNGKITKKIVIEGLAVSKSVIEKIESANGKIK